MHWFAIESSSSRVSLAIGEDSNPLREVAETGNASILIEPLFRRLEVDFETLQLCVVGRGPGSYNGLRVGYAFLKGLLCFSPLPVAQVDSPLILAAQAREELKMENGKILVLNNARRQEIHGTLITIKAGLPKMEWERVGSEKEMAQKIFSLDAVVSYDFSSKDFPSLAAHRWLSLFPTASMAGRLAHQLALPSTLNLSELEPHYVRAAVPIA